MTHVRAMCSILVVLLLAVRVAASPTVDGPYVMRGVDGGWEAWSVETTADGSRKRVQPLGAQARITVPSVGGWRALEVDLRPPAKVLPDVVNTAPNAALFVVADTHGEFEILVDMLLAHGVIDDRFEWRFGRGHLVFLGDVFDRGPHQTEILWLIYQLEAQADRAGGGVHLVLGNHEAMVLGGDLRYLHPKYVKSAQVLGVRSYAELFGGESVLGQWLRSKHAVLRINDLLCLHGGISRALIDRSPSLNEINMSVRFVLNGTSTSPNDAERATFIMSRLGPLWYRGYFPEEKDFPTASLDDITRVRHYFGVRAILVGHTPVATITPLYGGKVVAVQVYPHHDEATGAVVFESLFVKNGSFFRARPNGTTEPLTPIR